MTHADEAWNPPTTWWAKGVPSRLCGPRPALDGDHAEADRALLLTSDLEKLRDALVGALSPSARLFRLRRTLVALPEDEYRTVVARLAELRTSVGSWYIRLASSVLADAEQQWVDEDVRTEESVAYQYPLLAASLTTREQLEIFSARSAFPRTGEQGLMLAYTAAVRIGPDIAFTMRDKPDWEWGGDDEPDLRKYADMLAHFATGEALDVLWLHSTRPFVTAAFLAAADRSPREAMRVLATAEDDSAKARRLRDRHARLHPDVAREFGIAPEPMSTAFPDDLPAVLREPPKKTSGRADALVLSGFHEPQPMSLSWKDEERTQWASACAEQYQSWQDPQTVAEWRSVAARTRPKRHGGSNGYEFSHLLALAPEEVALEYLGDLNVDSGFSFDALTRLVARLGSPAVDLLFAAARVRYDESPALLMPLTGAEPAKLMARWLTGKTFQDDAWSWFDRHIDSAAPDLIAFALAKKAADRKIASAALRALAARHGAVIRRVAAEFGTEVKAAVDALLATPESAQVPIPTPPRWCSAAGLPPVFLSENRTALPESAVTAVIVHLMMCGGDAAHPGITALRDIADPASLAEFGWALFEDWQLAGYPIRDRWVLHGLGLFGNDDTADRLTPLLCEWPFESAYARAVYGLEALTAIGTERALLHLHRLSENSKIGTLSYDAGKKIDEIAARLDLTTDELADRLVPALEFDDDGARTFDYGTRGFIVRLDDQLGLTVFDAERGTSGAWIACARRKGIPAPGVKDDSALAPAAHAVYRALRKNLKSETAEQIRRLEHAMVSGRRWTPPVHTRLFIEHPLLSRLARRLVWATFDAKERVTQAFRIAEDGSYAALDDKPVTLPADAALGIAHPVHLTGSVPQWAEVFADYEILQPFEQLHRRTFVADAPENAAGLRPFVDRTVSAGSLLGLLRRGWSDERTRDGVVYRFSRHVGGEPWVALEITPGIPLGVHASSWERQTITTAALHGANKLSNLHPVAAAELLRDLESLR
ncbi:DUF4132 domain-containing protein [Nocardia sp. 2]|uniref:DUF4132 domain-containing protein n=1 Tax=Nocardia acididurans TaxID=2802282 RepID=A0ABS1M5T3_9NOCA|nr:DUF4132 domain-containing protein [Nocardia acididurans]MBL1074483.1 DUF4132 domain-containing protein [Nocardia acididurans]